MKPTILITDRDLGFVFWLGQALDAVGYEAFPARGVVEAAALIDELKLAIDLLVINPFLEGVTEFITTLRQSRPMLRIVLILPENEGVAPRDIDAVAAQRKPVIADDAARAEWLATIKNALPEQPYFALRAG